MKIFIFLIFLILLNNSYACEETNLKTDDITIWLGSNSKFSQEYIKGKCALDEALIDLPLEQKKVIANLIAKSYTHSLKNFKENSAYY